MKQVKVKKIKKIPKYYNGSLAVNADPTAGLNINTPEVKVDKSAAFRSIGNKIQNGIGSAMNTVGSALPGIASVASPIAGALGIEQSEVGQTIGAIGAGISKINPIAGAAVQILGATAGGRAKFDSSKVSTTSNINDSVSHNSGWIGGLFGADRDQLLRDAAQWQNSMVATEMTSNLQAEWTNDPRNQGMVSTLKEGGLVPGEHYASRNEVEVDSDGNNAVRYAWDPKGKDTYHVYTNPDGSSAEGNMIFNEEGVKRPNGMKYSDTAEMIITHTKDPKLKKINLKKLAAEQEVEKAKEGKTKNGIPAYGGGDDGKKELATEIAARKMARRSLDDYFIHQMNDGTFVLQDIDGGRYPIPEEMLWGIKQADNGGYYFDFTQTGVAPSAGKWNGNMNFAKAILNSKNVAKLRNTLTKILPKGSKAATSTKALDAAKAEVATERAIAEQQRLMSQAWLRGKSTGNPYAGATAGRDVASQGLWNLPNSANNADNILISEGIKNSMPYYLALAGMLGGATTFLSSEYAKNNPDTEDSRYKQNITGVPKQNINETYSGDVTPLNTETDQNIQELPAKTEEISTQSSGKRRYSKNSGSARSIALPTVELDPVNVDERVKINGDELNYALYDPNRTDGLQFDFSKPIEAPIEGKVRTSPTFQAMLKNTNWEDFAYKAASVFTPLLDREKAETTRLQRPTWHGIPVAVDVLNQLQDAQLGYTLANYNTAQGGYTAGQQLAARGAAASDLARKRAAIHQWQTEQQNKNIAQNIASLNAHSNVLSEIENKEIDINDANRAAARSVERQRRAEAMKNWGQVLRDKNQQAMDDMRMIMIEPLLQYAYENPEAIKKIYNKRSK